MLIPTNIETWAQLAVPGPDYWAGTAAQYVSLLPIEVLPLTNHVASTSTLLVSRRRRLACGDHHRILGATGHLMLLGRTPIIAARHSSSSLGILSISNQQLHSGTRCQHGVLKSCVMDIVMGFRVPLTRRNTRSTKSRAQVLMGRAAPAFAWSPYRKARMPTSWSSKVE